MALVGEPFSQELGILQSQCKVAESGGRNVTPSPRNSLSVFEIIISSHQPVLESLLLQLPTSAILDLYHTSRYLRSFFQGCPLAWNTLSFRKPHSNVSITQRQHSPASDSSGETSTRRSKPYALDQLLNSVVLPFGLSIRCLCLDQTAVSGLTLTSSILPARRETLQHLSIRGCKNVSLKYHIVPYLNLFKLQRSIESPSSSVRTDRLALKSLYTFRCAHHRRRPYMNASLRRPDSDAKATHEFILLCHSLDIWIDTGWCPTPGGRCSRRKQYFNGRASSDLQSEVWVVFDRLWRSRNQIGSSKQEGSSVMKLRGQLWKDEECGYNGEALGTDRHSCASDSKLTPAHLRPSHRIFVENFACQTCGDFIPERCEQCSIKTHCMGCRKTWCASCAYTRPLPAFKNSGEHISGEQDKRDGDSFWWAPSTRRSPNLMNQEIADGGSSMADAPAIPSRQTSWCCIRPQFSAGGQIILSRQNVIIEHDHVCTAPLPQDRGFEDPEFLYAQESSEDNHHSKGLRKSIPRDYDPMLYWLLYGFGYGPLSNCPRNLCNDCRQTKGWKAVCRACQEPICLAHDIRGLQTRVCGYRDLHVEDTIIKERMLHAAQEALRRKHTQIEIMDRITTHLQKHGTINAKYEYEYALITELPNGDDNDLQEHLDEEADRLQRSSTNDDGMATNAFAILPFQPPPFNLSNGPLNTSNIWRGCSTFICQEYRPLDDHRRPCPASIKKCTECGVHVCFECSAKQELCDCSYCSDNYRCLNCMPNFEFEKCKKTEEMAREGEEEQDDAE